MEVYAFDLRAVESSLMSADTFMIGICIISGDDDIPQI